MEYKQLGGCSHPHTGPQHRAAPGGDRARQRPHLHSLFSLALFLDSLLFPSREAVTLEKRLALGAESPQGPGPPSSRCVAPGKTFTFDGPLPSRQRTGVRRRASTPSSPSQRTNEKAQFLCALCTPTQPARWNVDPTLLSVTVPSDFLAASVHACV